MIYFEMIFFICLLRSVEFNKMFLCILFILYCIKFKKWKMNAIFTTSFSYNTYQKDEGKQHELWLLVEYIEMKVTLLVTAYRGPTDD